MKPWMFALAMTMCLPARASTPALSSLRAVHSLTGAEASQGLPAAFEATVIYYDLRGTDLFVQDGDLAVYVFAHTGLHLVPGDRVWIQGRTHEDFRPDVVGSAIRVLRHDRAPAPVVATFSQLIHTQLDCRRVTVRAQVRSADIVHDGDQVSLYLHLLMDGGTIAAAMVDDDQRIPDGLLDANVEVTGAVAGNFDSKMQLTGIVLEVQGLTDVKVLTRAGGHPQSLPLTPMDEILKVYDVNDRTQRVRVNGTVTYYEAGTALVLQEGAKSLWVTTQFAGPLRTGEVVDVVGFPDVRNGALTLTYSTIYPTKSWAPVAPLEADWEGLAPGKHAFDLVSTEGTVLAAVRGATQDEYVLDFEGHLFSAIFRHPDEEGSALAPMKQVPAGSRVRVTGICTPQYGSDPLGAPVAFEILLRSFDDVQVLASPSVLNVRNLIRAVSVLLLVVVGFAAWGWTLKGKVQRQAAAMARRVEAEAVLERRRSQILEDINAGRPLAEVLELITSLVSFSLNGAPCWCGLEDGTQTGKAAGDPSTVIRQEIPSRSGKRHGEIVVSFDAEGTSNSANAPEALAMGSWLASLAIETRGLYSDLLHRSEFDLLTDIRNRFSLDKLLYAAIDLAQRENHIFGLIYIDLDRFKQINDQFGHHAGDQFLRAAALRMRNQLRPGDTLGRLGGDEFAVLVSMVSNRLDVEGIAARLERCFDDPFDIGGYLLQGSASFGVALYPEDGTTRDTLFHAADGAMYEAKQKKCPEAAAERYQRELSDPKPVVPA
jgi:diguanylate cyclase (GGDEF)-like protein